MSENSPTSRLHCCTLTCCVTFESSSPDNRISRAVYKQATVTLGRNQTRDIVVLIELQSKSVSYFLSDVRVHHTFAVKEGKGCISISSRLKLFLSNCAPVKLKVFLKTLEAKLELMQKGTPHRAVASGLPRIDDELSPLTVAEIRKLTRGSAMRDRTNLTPTTPCMRTHKQGADATTTPVSSKSACAKKRPSVESALSGVARPKRLLTDGLPKRQEKADARPSVADPTRDVCLDDEQREVVRIVSKDESVFFTGSAGTGKSFLLRKLIGLLPSDSCVVTAATGVAAAQIGGITLHSFAGLPPIERLPSREYLVEFLSKRSTLATRWRKCSHLIIDEISMIDADYFTALEHLARVAKNSRKPFGGIQLVLSGDFFQLPPVRKFGEAEKHFCFESAAWTSCVRRTVFLRKIHRQTDREFVEVLEEIRFGRCSAGNARLLEATSENCLQTEGILPTHLCTHRDNSKTFNDDCLASLTGEERCFEAIDSEVLLESRFDEQCPRMLRLRVGAQVMLTRNLDVRRNLCNGSRGVVVSFSGTGWPVVRFLAGHVETIRPCAQLLKMSASASTQITRMQVPLKLAWAMSIHKSQGMTLDCVEMDLERVFEAGQAYVALSRAKRLNSLRVVNFSAACVRADRRVLAWYERMLANNAEQGANDGSVN